jgi:hypothetical protein
MNPGLVTIHALKDLILKFIVVIIYLHAISRYIVGAKQKSWLTSRDCVLGVYPP